ncbi:TetR/AcrR family transcriptional regulator [Herbiconiux liangxiaofengii]|uniref:TetR/AcrR family transcriptional regulator n=1 Tax=Herbiconiux liangxiaofengii TaxID=3342795 RepID=UPI0035B85529
MDPIGGPPGPLNPTVGLRPPERSDAARNRELLLETARRLVDQGGGECLTMDRLAAESGVGKGTIFRRFGSRAGLFQALLDDSEREFQAGFLSGPPPLGPGAPPVERLVAFGRAQLATAARQVPLLRAAERPADERYAVPARRLAEVHIGTLLRQAGVDGDIPVLSFNLMAMLDAIVWLPDADLERMLPRLTEGWEDLVRRLT